MSHLTDTAYLMSDQYRTPANLNARADLHRLYSTDPYPWQRWVFDRLTVPAPARILELGCGPGYLWRENLDRLPPGWSVTLSDLSPGMLDEARRSLGECCFRFEQVDARSIPFDDGCFDAVIANHMLYHVPDRPRALAEISRVLARGGRLFAATNGSSHMRELFDLITQCAPSAQPGMAAVEFSLDNGAAQLEPWFAPITAHRRQEGLDVTDAEPLIAYALSSTAYGLQATEDAPACFASLVRSRLARDGRIFITKSGGLFEAVKKEKP